MLRVTLLSFILIASLVDAFLTDIGIRSGMIIEANPFMSWLYHQSILAFFLFKVTLPLLLLFLIRPKISKLLKGLIYITSGLYVFALAMHFVWIVTAYKYF
ncbi:hypothetical protein A8990_102132 [Paenibacillus taihuensis]|uniref:DUF5658 domain-containing protein n=1 Tax=Paenibacillus taihuensis TaxID=1156355 RepID=A0A3D9SDU9_9BACL|nr:DUF5658 family protein [Paenibacillus taihuensis]REE93046.1 hypothetical protein A8990_102132 [Paenibacillus taihuensis]